MTRLPNGKRRPMFRLGQETIAIAVLPPVDGRRVA